MRLWLIYMYVADGLLRCRSFSFFSLLRFEFYDFIYIYIAPKTPLSKKEKKKEMSQPVSESLKWDIIVYRVGVVAGWNKKKKEKI